MVTQYFWPENFRINDLVAELSMRGHDVTVLTGFPNYPLGQVFEQYRKNPHEFYKYERAKIIRVPMLPRGKGGLRLLLNYITFAVSATFFGLIKLRKRMFDVIFVFEPSPITVGLPAAALRAAKRVPIAFWVLDLWPQTLQAIGVVRSPVILKIIGFMVSFIYKRCDLILAQSYSFIPCIKQYSGLSADIRYFPSWADGVFDMDDSVAAPEIPFKTDAFNIMFAGNIGDAQDFPAILAAAEKLKSHIRIRWLILGDGRMRNWVASEIKRRKLNDSVLMLGQFPVDRMPSFFKCADALLVSLKNEPIFSLTIPGKVQSYLAVGKPVVAMLNGEGAEIIQGSHAGLTCAAGDSDALAEAILKMSRMSPEELRAMGRNGLNASAMYFDRNALISKLETWLEDLSVNYKNCKRKVI